ncbi:MAG: DNA repair protein RecO [Saprospiraceae bacterium]
MDIITTEGIIFRRIKYAETSLICDIFTREKGLKSYIVSGARKSGKNPTGSIYQVGNIVSIVAYNRTDEKLNRIKDIQLAYHYEHVGIDVIKSTTLLFIMEVSRNSIREKEENYVLYDFITQYVTYIDSTAKLPNTILHLFLVEFSFMLGFGPSTDLFRAGYVFDLENGNFSSNYLSKHVLNEHESTALMHIIRSNINEIQTVEIERNIRSSLLESLILYYKMHIPAFTDVHALDILRQVFMT